MHLVLTTLAGDKITVKAEAIKIIESVAEGTLIVFDGEASRLVTERKEDITAAIGGSQIFAFPQPPAAEPTPSA
jgi:uncharacterized protein YlzI (FlbEa/FlbD family)